MRRLAFEAGLPARAFIAKQTQRWAAAAAARDAPQQPLVQTAYAGNVDCMRCVAILIRQDLLEDTLACCF